LLTLLLLFPSESDDCRFPHVLPDNSGPHQQFVGGRGGAPRSRPHVNGSNGIGTIEEKMSGMTLRDVSRYSFTLSFFADA